MRNCLSRLFLLILVCCLGRWAQGAEIGLAGAVLTDGVDVPGLSAPFHAAPFYTCKHNYYVSTRGSDDNPGTLEAPWLTIQHADEADHGRLAGDCVNVERGIYPAGSIISRGGNNATASGYVVYRCVELGSCKITNSQYGFKFLPSHDMVNYVVIDGFELAARQEVVYGQGIFALDIESKSFQSHHLWIINNTIHGYGQSGIQINNSDYVFIIHNVVFGNSGVTCDAQGSGISLAVPFASPKHDAPWADNNMSIGPFHNLISFNITHHNTLKQCGSAQRPSNTDGNGIILDTFSGVPGLPAYPFESLVAFNVSYDNGGKGINIFKSDGAGRITVANNTLYNNNLDPFNNGESRGEITETIGANNLFVNNLSYAITGTGYLKKNIAYFGDGAQSEFVTNVGFCGRNTSGCYRMFNGARWASGFDVTDPGWIAPGVNFGLTSGSPAIDRGQSLPYLPAQSADIGACSHSLRSCGGEQ